MTHNQESTYVPLLVAITHLSILKQQSIDTAALREQLSSIKEFANISALNTAAQKLDWGPIVWADKPDESRYPMLYIEGDKIAIVVGKTPNEKTIFSFVSTDGQHFTEKVLTTPPVIGRYAQLDMRRSLVFSKSPVTSLIVTEIISEKRKILDIALASVALGVLSLVISFYTMQVYDRVIPTSAYATLLALTIGVFIATFLELIGKWSRSLQLNSLADDVDQRLARSVYSRFLGIRMDQLPNSVGTTAQSIRGYEGFRSFFVTLSITAMIDTPISILLLTVIWSIGGWLAIVPALFLVAGLSVGIGFKSKIEYLATKSKPSENLKMGILVESIEGAEIIKSGNGGWRMLSKWLNAADDARKLTRRITEFGDLSKQTLATLQQISYVIIVASGSVMVGNGEMTMGGLIACSILSGRVMTPISTYPNLMVQWGQVKASLKELDNMWSLQQDLPFDKVPIVDHPVSGELELKDVVVSTNGSTRLRIPQLLIGKSERIAIVGPVGSGKTTLLRLMTGMFKPAAGALFLGGIDMELLSNELLADKIGFVPQDGRLFSGTIRDNLLIGMLSPGDSEIIKLCKQTGLYDSVIADSPEGLNRPVFEGGGGLSGGQRQLIHLTRALMKNRNFLLMDEPTASMDASLELRAVKRIRKELEDNPAAALIVVTHKPEILTLVDRIIVLNQGQIVEDGHKDYVLKKLMNARKAV